MSNAFDAVDFALYLRTRWRVAAICCLSGMVLAGVTAKLLPKRYTATATLIIQPPASSDPRAAQAVSPVYLESLKTYENYATSDTLFSKALAELGLRGEYPGASIESLKRSVLSVSKPAATRVIEIRATLRDPIGAKRLAQYLAEQTVAMNRSMDEHGSDAAVASAAKNLAAAEERLRAAMRAGTGTSVEALSSDLKSSTELRYELQRGLAQAKAELADLTAQRNSFAPGDEKGAWNDREIAATSARIRELDGQGKKLDAAVYDQASRLEHARPVRDAIEAEQKLARADAETMRTKLTELRASPAYRGERIEVLDPGIVPERSSYPNVPLVVLVAFAVSLLASVAYLAAAFGYGRALSAKAEHVYHMR